MPERGPGAAHPPAAAFTRLLGGEATPAETREVIRHLLAGCPGCSAAARRAHDAARSRANAPGEAAAPDYGEVFDRVRRRLRDAAGRQEAERAMARRLLDELTRHPALDTLCQIHSTRRYASLSLCQLLLAASAAAWASDPEAAARAAHLALAAAEHLDSDLYGGAVVQDLRAVGWAYLATSAEVEADVATAASALALAEELLETGTGDPLARAELLTLGASLDAIQGRFEPAVRRLNRSHSLYRRLGEDHLAARVLLKKALLLGNSGAAGSAVRLLERAARDLVPEREPRLAVCLAHNLAWYLAEHGSPERSHLVIERAATLYSRSRDRTDLARLRWLEGRLAQASGRLDEAETVLAEARTALTAHAPAYEAAFATADLALLHAARRNGDAMRREAGRILPLFDSPELYQETGLALLSYESLADQPAPSAAFLDDIAGFLDRARRAGNTLELGQGSG